MIISLSALTQPGSLIICSGYKDEGFIGLGLQAIKFALALNRGRSTCTDALTRKISFSIHCTVLPRCWIPWSKCRR